MLEKIAISFQLWLDMSKCCHLLSSLFQNLMQIPTRNDHVVCLTLKTQLSLTLAPWIGINRALLDWIFAFFYVDLAPSDIMPTHQSNILSGWRTGTLGGPPRSTECHTRNRCVPNGTFWPNPTRLKRGFHNRRTARPGRTWHPQASPRVGYPKLKANPGEYLRPSI